MEDEEIKSHIKGKIKRLGLLLILIFIGYEGVKSRLFGCLMRKREFYKIQADSFRDYASKCPDRDLLSLFNEWAESKDIYGVDKQEIWRIARNLRPRKTKIIREASEEFVRLSAVIDFLLQADLSYLNKLVERKKKEEGKEGKEMS